MSAATVADNASCRSIRPLCACINTHNGCHWMNAAAPEPRRANTEDGCIAIPGNVSTAAVAALLRQQCRAPACGDAQSSGASCPAAWINRPDSPKRRHPRSLEQGGSAR
jgi:hypothetical protein